MISMLDPIRTNALFQEELEAAALKVLRSGKYILGEEVAQFERNCAAYLGCTDAIAVSSGTDALLLSLMTLGIGPGDEVICPSFTFFATAGAIARTGAKPVFVDIQPDCFTCDLQSIKDAITDKTRAIIPVHLFGQCADMIGIMDIARTYGLYVIEDACQAIGAELDGKKAGTFGHTGCFSFFPSKNLGGFGDTGLVTTNDPELAYELRAMRVHGGKDRYYHERIGGNFRPDTIQCALLDVKLKHLDEARFNRALNADTYQRKLKDLSWMNLPKQVRGKHVWNQFTIRVLEDRLFFQAYLEDRGIGCAIYYPLPLHKQECFKDIVPEGLELPETDRAAEEVISIPIYEGLTANEQKTIIDALRHF